MQCMQRGLVGEDCWATWYGRRIGSLAVPALVSVHRTRLPGLLLGSIIHDKHDVWQVWRVERKQALTCWCAVLLAGVPAHASWCQCLRQH